jgi:hypothetical protein
MHTNPEVLALLALGENPTSSADQQHLLNCAYCQAELADLRRVTRLAQHVDLSERLDTPPAVVWERIQEELARYAQPSLQGAEGEAGSPMSSSAPERHGDAGLATSEPLTAPTGRFDGIPVDQASEPSATDRSATAERRPPPTSQARSRAAEQEGQGSQARQAGARAQPAEPAQPSGTRGEATNPPGGRRAGYLALAAGLALFAGIGIGVAWDRWRQPGEVVGQATLEARPGWSGASGSAEVRQDSHGNRTLVVTLTTPQPVQGTRQVWLLTSDGGMQPVGFINGDRGFWAIPNGMDLRRFAVVDVSDEPVNDSNVAHSGNSIVRGQLTP